MINEQARNKAAVHRFGNAVAELDRLSRRPQVQARMAAGADLARRRALYLIDAHQLWDADLAAETEIVVPGAKIKLPGLFDNEIGWLFSESAGKRRQRPAQATSFFALAVLLGISPQWCRDVGYAETGEMVEVFHTLCRTTGYDRREPRRQLAERSIEGSL